MPLISSVLKFYILVVFITTEVVSLPCRHAIYHAPKVGGHAR